jgi:hypothetical protein
MNFQDPDRENIRLAILIFSTFVISFALLIGAVLVTAGYRL